MLIRPLRRLLTRSTAVSHFHTFPPCLSSRRILQNFKLADIGEGITECEVIRWNVKELGTIQSFEPLCEVQSDKASVEITSPFDGVVKEILVKEGEVAKVGQGLCVIEVDEELSDSGSVEQIEPASSDAPAPLPMIPNSKLVEDAASRTEHIPEELSAPRRLHPMDPNYISPSTPNVNPENVLAKPSVRHYARQSKVDLTLLSGSGRDGRIEKKDIDAFLSQQASSSSTHSGSAALRAQAEQDVIVELGRTRYGMWKAMTQSLEIPHFGYSTSLDLTSLHSLLPTLNSHIPSHFNPSKSSPLPINPSALHPAPSPPPVPESAQFTRLTYLPILLKTLAKAMMAWPVLRSSITPGSANGGGKPTLTIRPHADIAVALSTTTGLYTPVIPHADTHSIYSLSSQLKHLSFLGRQVPCALTVNEMPKRGATVTLSNVGAIGDGEYAHPVLVPGGGVAIVAIGRARWVWDVSKSDRGERRLKVGVSWSADHRVLEGAELAAFVESWRAYVEAPERLIGEGI
ncbi:2-oxoacid dehydrogenases acyltransferase-domain-containing protein [Suillus subaureus]|uniref:Dihydrolipoamide acetyltransferase component of pyruvate dehydrogenase complex n=1 Tax=Suillus subaureus TaxID=48587 RepID=A0A9P7E8C0_9AGAM|nr:2-oxoacid dehydrogenases acyltransferase-domain-containing protein [Suillus subaureus]KAG1814236.1 2-oxoacid dehydrogenases acyltransferase-domain-containing protein [Suillus subaureus]